MQKLPLSLFIFLFIFPLATAIEIDIAKSSYFPEETFQAEITGDFVEPLTINNIFFYKDNEEISLIFDLIKLASNKYFVYVDLPDTAGFYSFAVENALYTDENQTLKSENATAIFEIKKSISSAYSWLADEAVWSDLTSEEAAFALLALNYEPYASAGKTSLLEKSKDNECWPKDECKVKDTALALLALDDLNYDIEDIRNWLINAENSIDNGEWSLIVQSDDNRTCILEMNEQNEEIGISSGNNSIDLNLPDDNPIIITFGCIDVTAKISNTYLGSVNDFSLTLEEDVLKTTINNAKCWGNSYRSECNALSTAYALWALNRFYDITEEKRWLEDNAEETQEKAFAYLFTKDETLKNWLLNNQAVTGYWSDYSLALSNESSIKATASVLLALESQKAENWLKQQQFNNEYNSFGNLIETAFVLHSVFPKSKIEPILSITPAIIKAKTGDSIKINFANKGITDIILNASIPEQQTTKNTNISVDSSEELTFLINLTSEDKIVFTNIELDYTSVLSNMYGKYKIPLIVWTKGEIDETQIIENTTLLPASLKFIEEQVDKEISEGEETTIEVKLKNILSQSIKNIVLTTSWSLIDIIEIKPSKIEELGAGQTAIIDITVNSKEAFGSYTGTIEATAEGISVSLPININIELQEEEKACYELEGIICDVGETCEGESIVTLDTMDCCLGICKRIEEEKEGFNKKIIGIILIIIAVAAIAIFLLKKLRKPKQYPELKDVLGRIEQKYK